MAKKVGKTKEEKLTSPTSAFDLVPVSFDLVKKQLPLYALVSIASLTLAVIQAVNGKEYTGVISFENISEYIRVTFGAPAGVLAVLLIASVVLQTMAIGLQLKSAKDKSTTANELWEIARKYTFRLIGLGLLSGLLILGGLFLLIIPGILIFTRIILAPYVMINEDKGIIDSMKRSAEITKGYGLSIWSVIGVSILLTIIAQILFGLFSVVIAAIAATAAGIIYSVAPAIRYFELKKLSK